MSFVAHVVTHAHLERRVEFDLVRLVVPGRGGWKAGTCEFVSASGLTLPTATLTEINSTGPLFPVVISDGTADLASDSFQGLTTDFPFGADAFLWSEMENGFWGGLTLATAFGRLSVNPYACDPT